MSKMIDNTPFKLPYGHDDKKSLDSHPNIWDNCERVSIYSFQETADIVLIQDITFFFQGGGSGNFLLIMLMEQVELRT
jgi:hypothetical protein